jgi:TonB family protein
MIEALLDSLWQGALIVAVAAGVTAFVPERHAATRYAVWFAALVALVLLPLSGLISFGQAASAIPGSVVRPARIASHVAEQAANANGLWFAAVWLFGVAIGMARFALNVVRIGRIAQSALPAPHLGRNVATSTMIDVPIAAGVFNPIVILPHDLPAAVDGVDLQSIIAHEHAHIRRRDILGNLFQRLLECLLFFNPWMYVIGRQLVKEREAACDDWAVAAASDPDRYAACLANVALRNQGMPAPLLTPSAIGSERMLVRRIARLLNGKATEVKTNYIVLASAIALFALLGFALQAPGVLASTGTTVTSNTPGTLPAACWSEVSVINAVPPDIPDSVVKAHPNSRVTLLVTVSPAGRATDVRTKKSSGIVAIDGAAADAAVHSTYRPAKRNCKAVSGQYLFRVTLGP